MKKKTLNKYLLILFFIGFSFAFYACQSERTESPIKGNLIVYSDVSLYPITKKLADEFQRLYKEAKLEVVPVLTTEGIAKIINDECSIFISSRDFNKEEKEIVTKNNLNIRTYDFLYDGVAVIGNKKSKTDSLTQEELTEYLLQKKYTGKIVMPYKNTGTYDFIKDDILMGKEPVTPQFVSDERDVIKIVRANPNKIGLIGCNLLDDSSDVKVFKVGKISALTMEMTFYSIHPGYLYKKTYPLARKCVVFLRENYIGLAGGFTTFITFTDGQKIVLENNLAPAAVPVKINNNY